MHTAGAPCWHPHSGTEPRGQAGPDSCTRLLLVVPGANGDATGCMGESGWLGLHRLGLSCRPHPALLIRTPGSRSSVLAWSLETPQNRPEFTAHHLYR